MGTIAVKNIKDIIIRNHNGEPYDTPECIFKFLIKRIKQILNHEYDYSNPELLMENMYNTIVKSILETKVPTDDNALKIYLNLLKIEEWFDDIRIFQEKMLELKLIENPNPIESNKAV